MTFNCFKCKQEIVFDSEHIGKTGRKIPLDPDTHAPHDCPQSDFKKEQTETSRQNEEKIKNDHGNELVQPKAESPKEMYERYVDHTLPPKLKLKVLTSTEAEGLSLAYNNFGDSHNIRFSQYQIAGSLYTIAVWYEEIPLKQ